VYFTNCRGSDKLQNIIQDLRKKKKVTQSELADAVNVTRQTIISLENGKYNASLILAHKIAQFFGGTIEDVFIFDQEDENL
jgi:putative transcriptional regulator